MNESRPQQRPDDAPRRLIGRGIYTAAEASRLTRVLGPTMRRWCLGYRLDENRVSAPVVQPDLGMIDGVLILSFLDLQEVRFVHAFRKHGVSWKTIRATYVKAREELGSPHPFSTGKFLTDGRSLLLDAFPRRREAALLNILRDQWEFRRIVAPFLKELDFDRGQAVRWWPPEGHRRVVIDPQRNFGQATLNKQGVPTAILARAHTVEPSMERVARWFEVPVPAVKVAVEFEAQLAA